MHSQLVTSSLGATIAVAITAGAHAQVSIWTIEPAAGLTYSMARSVSGDGTFVAANTFSFNSDLTVGQGWRSDTGAFVLTGGSAGSSTFARQAGNGARVVGATFGLPGSDSVLPAAWSMGSGWSSFSGVPPHPSSYAIAQAASADGHVVVGASGLDFTFGANFILGDLNLGQAWRVRNGVGEVLTGLGADALSGAFDVSSNGDIAVGQSGNHAVRWDASGQIQQLDFFQSNVFSSVAVGVTASGTAVVGNFSGTSGLQGFLWTEAAGFQTLSPAIGFTGSFAEAVSADGNVVVGAMNRASNLTAMLYTPGAGMQSLESVLISSGVNLDEWQSLTAALDVSDDGRTIVGYGVNTAGDYRGFVVTIPSPGVTALFCIVAPVFTRRRRGR